LEGPRCWSDAMALAARAGRAAGLLVGLQTLASVLRDGLRGFALRRRMLKARKPGP